MNQYYRHIDENGTEISIHTSPTSNQIRIVLLPEDAPGAMYRMPWTEQLQFSAKLQDAKDEAERNDEAAEGLAFLRAMTGVDRDYADRKTAMQYFQRAEAYFQKRHFPEGPS